MMRTDKTSAVLRAAAPLIGLALLAGVGGCAPQVASVAPLAAMAASEAVASTNQAATSQASAAEGESAQHERCDQLLKAPPGVEEVRLAADNTIWSREIRVDQTGPYPRWIIYRHKNSNADGWRPQTDITRLEFTPRLDHILSQDDPRFLAYAVMIPQKPEESERRMSIAEDFGSQAGRFKWRGRIYSFSLVKELPCFPGPD